MMTDNERTELELYIDVLNSLIADFYRIASKHDIALDNNDKIGNYYRKMIKYVICLRKSTSYEDVLIAKRNIDTIKGKLAKLEACHDI
jgi:hypothetical protein